jgi:ubiquinone/menaquinone biosynthesis C-methylase UbiE
MFAAFLRELAPGPDSSIADVGVTSDLAYDHSNYLEAWYPHKAQITAIGVEDASFLEKSYPGVRFIRASGLDLPFDNESFDFVHSSAVIEHVGSTANQTQFLSELWRVARHGIFVTTPDSRFPIEVHTVLPLIHYLPPAPYRRLLQMMGFSFFADEKNLNMMSKSSMAEAATKAGVDSFHISSARLLGLSSNLMLIGKKVLR